MPLISIREETKPQKGFLRVKLSFLDANEQEAAKDKKRQMQFDI